MSDLGAALGAAFPSSARAEASRINGARSCGPKTPEGKARASQNALKHGLRAQKFVVVGDEKAAEFVALEAALSEELAPDGALQGLLAARIARAAWRLERAERIEAELFERHAGRDRNLGLAMIRDGNGTRAFDALLRYRGTALAELWRALRLLKALQAEAAREVGAPALVPTVLPAPHLDITGEKPIEPEARANPGEIAPVPAADEPEAVAERVADASDPPGGEQATGSRECPAALREKLLACRGNPIEPEGRRNLSEIALAAPVDEPEIACSGPTGADADAADPDSAARPKPAQMGSARPGSAFGVADLPMRPGAAAAS